MRYTFEVGDKVRIKAYMSDKAVDDPDNYWVITAVRDSLVKSKLKFRSSWCMIRNIKDQEDAEKQGRNVASQVWDMSLLVPA